MTLIGGLAGCGMIPRPVRQQTIHNPFPQLTKVAVAPFFNLAAEPTIDGRQFALAYYNELQLVPGFEVVPIGVVEAAMQKHRLSLSDPSQVRTLAQILEVDAVAIGAITDFSSYYPPRLSMQVEWYAANPCFHPVPPGYGLPWGTKDEKKIPLEVVRDAEHALARAQLETQTPATSPAPMVLEEGALPGEMVEGEVTLAGPIEGQPSLPPNWPDGKGLIPAGPSCETGQCVENNEPVLRHTKTYNGHDAEFTAKLANYVEFRDDARFGGWQSYLQRSDDFIRFCCHQHIQELLAARGGAGETRVLWRWPDGR